MADDQIKDHLRSPDKAKGAAPSDTDERDATIERLERAIVEERQHAARLRETAEELRFKAKVLETSYAKQLEDARMRSETMERELADQQARMAELDSAREDAIRLLREARAELERITADPAQSRKTLASTNGPQMESPTEEDLTINTLMRDSSWVDERRRADQEKENPEAQVQADQESPPEELIAPELVFTGDEDD